MPRFLVIAMVLGLVALAVLGALVDLTHGRRPVLLARPTLSAA